MSRSSRRFPLLCVVGGHTSLHDWRRSYNRALRRRVRQLLRHQWQEENMVLPTIGEVGNPYDGPRDGTGTYDPFRSSGPWSRDGGVYVSRHVHYKTVFMK